MLRCHENIQTPSSHRGEKSGGGGGVKECDKLLLKKLTISLNWV